MSKPEYTAWPAECVECHNYGALVLCNDCSANVHLDCAEYHRCRCPYCGKPMPDGGPCDPYCEEKEHGEGFYDGDKWRRE